MATKVQLTQEEKEQVRGLTWKYVQAIKSIVRCDPDEAFMIGHTALMASQLDGDIKPFTDGKDYKMFCDDLEAWLQAGEPLDDWM